MIRTKIANALRIAADACRPYQYTYIGGTSQAHDAFILLRKWAAGEPLGDGRHIGQYENALARYHGVRYAVSFGAGRMALYAILRAMDLQADDEIILPGYTCIVTANAIRFAGLKPVYVDVCRDDFNIDLGKIAAAITNRTRAILAQHTFGVPCDLDELAAISRRYGVPIIEDGAHAIGARWAGRPVGGFGLAAFFSTEGSKMFSTERGGYALTDDAALHERLRAIQQEAEFFPPRQELYCLWRWCYRAALCGYPLLQPRTRVFELLAKKLSLAGVMRVLTFDAANYACEINCRRFTPYPARLGNLMAYAGLRQLLRIERDLRHRRQLAADLEAALGAMGVAVARYDHAKALPSWVRFPFVVRRREPWIDLMNTFRIPPGFWLNDPVHPVESDWEGAGYVAGTCPYGEYLSEHILNVPVHGRIPRALLETWVARARALHLE